MNLELEKVAVGDRAILERLLQLELYDVGMEPGPDGLIDWGESLDKFFDDPSCIPLFLKMHGQLAGLALLKLNRKLPGPDRKTCTTANLLEEFYVMRPHRRKGLGTRAMDLVLRDYPGQWIVTTWPDSQRVRFWRYVAMGRNVVKGREFGPDEYGGFPGQHVWVIEPNKPDKGNA